MGRWGPFPPIIHEPNRMQKVSKKMILPVLALGAVVSFAGISAVSADEADAGPERMIQKLAERFNISQDDLASFFEEERQTRQEERQKDCEDRLTEAVESGELSEEQKQLILAKHEEMRQRMEDERGNRGEESREEREAHRAEMESRRAELEQWAEDNGIDMKYFGGPEGPHGPEGKGGPRGGSGFGNGRNF